MIWQPRPQWGREDSDLAAHTDTGVYSAEVSEASRQYAEDEMSVCDLLNKSHTTNEQRGDKENIPGWRNYLKPTMKLTQQMKHDEELHSSTAAPHAAAVMTDVKLV